MEKHLKHFALLALDNPHNPYSEDIKGDIHCFSDKELFRYTMYVVTECMFIISKQKKDMSPEKVLGAEMCIEAIQKEFKSVMDKVVAK